MNERDRWKEFKDSFFEAVSSIATAIKRFFGQDDETLALNEDSRVREILKKTDCTRVSETEYNWIERQFMSSPIKHVYRKENGLWKEVDIF